MYYNTADNDNPTLIFSFIFYSLKNETNPGIPGFGHEIIGEMSHKYSCDLGLYISFIQMNI